MTEFEERLTHEYSKLAEQYAQEQKELSAQVESLGKQVRQWAEQSAQERKAHTEWASTLVEQQQQLGAHVTTLTDAYDSLSENVNRMIDLGREASDALRASWPATRPFQSAGVIESTWLPPLLGAGSTAASSLLAGNVFLATFSLFV